MSDSESETLEERIARVEREIALANEQLREARRQSRAYYVGRALENTPWTPALIEAARKIAETETREGWLFEDDYLEADGVSVSACRHFVRSSM